MSERRPDLQTIINRALASGMRDVYTMVPAKVVKYEAAKQRVNCQILIKSVTEGEDGSREVNSWPVVPGVPVQFPGAGPFRITCPISDGNLVIDGEQYAATTGSLFFSFLSLDKWLSGTGGEVDPEIDHHHALTDAVFVPGLRPFGAPLSSCPTDQMTIGHDSGKQIHFGKSLITIGDESGAEKMLLAETLIADLKAAATTINTILLGGTTGGPTAQNITQAAAWALTQLYTRLQANGVAYLSTQAKNR